MLNPKAFLYATAVLVAGVVAVAAGWWFLVREDAQLATESPEIPGDLVQSTASPSPAAAGASPTDTGDAASGDALTFRIIPERSEAAYFVDEELASLPLPSTAKGATSDIEGEIHVSADGTALANGMTSEFAVNLRTLTSDESRRDNRVQEALDTGAYPSATFTIARADGFDPAVPEGKEQSLTLTGTLDLHGVQRDVTWDVKARREANVITALATVTISFADFDITPPNIGGFVSVDDEATLQVQLVAELV